MKKTFLVILAVAMAVMLVSCTMPWNSIVGTWVNQNTVLGVVTETGYVFNEDGTGSRNVVLDVDFTYTVDGDSLTITYEVLGIEYTEEYTFKISGNTLTLTDDSGDTTTFEKAS